MVARCGKRAPKPAELEEATVIDSSKEIQTFYVSFVDFKKISAHFMSGKTCEYG